MKRLLEGCGLECLITYWAAAQGRNRVSVACVDSRRFCVVTQLARRRSVDEVKALMRAPESLEEALARVRGQVSMSTLQQFPHNAAGMG